MTEEHPGCKETHKDQGNDDAERHRKRHKEKNKHVSSKSIDRPRSPRQIRENSKTCKKSDGESRKVKSEERIGSQGSKHITIYGSGKHSSSPHYTATSAWRPGSHIPEALTNECRKSLGKRTSSEEPERRVAEEEEKRKKLIKRKASKEEYYPVAKRRSDEEETRIKSREKKNLEEMGYRKSNEKCISEWKHRGEEKHLGQRSSKESKRPACAVKPNVQPKFQGTGHAESVYPPVSTEKPPSSSPSQKISFKIPKKSNAKPQTSTACWEKIKKSPIINKRSPKIIDSPSVKVSSEHTRPKPTEVPSLLSSCSPSVQLVQSSSTDALVEHTRCNDVSTECTKTTDDYEMQIVEELHLARSNRQLEVKVEMSYGELTSMDVDPADESISTAALALGFPSLLIPWVVLQELDSLKSGKLSKNVESKARPAVDYIYTSLKNQVPRLWGQSMQQMSQASCRLNSVNNDDLVLQCCLQFKALYPEGAVILCTNDKNLCSKALLSGVKALSKADLQQQAAVNPEHFHQHYDPTPAYQHAAANKQNQEEEEAQRLREEAEANVKKETERELSECVSVLESSLQTALSAILEEEMKTAFGDLWLESEKPPVADRDGDMLMADAGQEVAPPPQTSHQEVWALFESIWNNVCQISSAVFSALHFSSGLVGSVEPQSTLSPEEALSCLHRLNVALEQLLEAFQRLLSVDSTVDDAQALLTFIHTSKLAAMDPPFIAKDLFECLSHQEYREKLCIGGTQLMAMRENLHRCAAAVCGTKT
ncbi:Transcriptional protein SWT1 [Bagarius yarrelli]|uniref:Transcriptional protein SWT1 n=1 Tax=Bagarius yarrelli TaxID=175774 RepID=A0A556TZF8_BAGYA|nr:Transcriptional protein SWT1 [Bagarius yarrelli]